MKTIRLKKKKNLGKCLVLRCSEGEVGLVQYIVRVINKYYYEKIIMTNVELLLIFQGDKINYYCCYVHE